MAVVVAQVNTQQGLSRFFLGQFDNSSSGSVGPFCGDGICNGSDTVFNCSADCGLPTSSASSVGCGNGVRDGGEQCDGSDLGGDSCTNYGFTSGDLTCGVDCTVNSTGCFNASSASSSSCASGGPVSAISSASTASVVPCGSSAGGSAAGSIQASNASTASVAGSSAPAASSVNSNACGNGTRNIGEECDGSDFGGDSCANHDFSGGSLSCDVDCTVITAGCFDISSDSSSEASTASNASAASDASTASNASNASTASNTSTASNASTASAASDASDTSDASNASTASDASTASNASNTSTASAQSASSASSASSAVSISPLCGNGALDPGEPCDGSLFTQDTDQCLDYGEQFTAGSVSCTVSCEVSIDQCIMQCGNGVIDPGEQCEPPGVGTCNNACQDIIGPPPPPQCPANCNDNNPCTIDGCNANTGQCFHNPQTGNVCRPTPLNQHPACNAAELCINGVCPPDGGFKCPELEVAVAASDGKAWLGWVAMQGSIIKGGVPPYTWTMEHDMPMGDTWWFEPSDNGLVSIPYGYIVQPAITAANGSNTALGRFFAQFVEGDPIINGPDGRDFTVEFNVTDAAGQTANAEADFNVGPLVSDLTTSQVCSCWSGQRNCDVHVGNLGPDPAADVNSTTTLHDVEYLGEMMPPTVVAPGNVNGNWQGEPGAVLFGGNNQVAYGTVGKAMEVGGELAGWPILELKGPNGGARDTTVNSETVFDPNLDNNVVSQEYSNKCESGDGPDNACPGENALFSFSFGSATETTLEIEIPLDECFDETQVTALQPPSCQVQGHSIVCSIPNNPGVNQATQVSFTVPIKDDCDKTEITTMGTIQPDGQTDPVVTSLDECGPATPQGASSKSSNASSKSNASGGPAGSNGSNNSNGSSGNSSSGGWNGSGGSNGSNGSQGSNGSNTSNSSRSGNSSGGSSVSNPGQCRGDECFLGGNAACAAVGLVCNTTPLLPCVQCVNPSSGSNSSRSNSTSSSRVSSSSTSVRSSSSSIGVCRADECSRGGDSFCAAQGSLCRPISGFPCIECYGGSSRSSGGSQSSIITCSNDIQCPNGPCVNGICTDGSSSSRSSIITCTDGFQCPNGQCVNGVCTDGSSSSAQGCTDNYQCPTGLCIDGQCTQCSDLLSCPLGACTNGNCPQCLENMHCPSGLCVSEQCVECTANEQCPSGICIDGKCTERDCISDLECPSRLCVDGRCMGCTLDDQCTSGRCDAGVCAALGCTANEQCPSGLCIDGMCTNCTFNEQCASNQCQDGVCVPPQTAAEALPAQLIDLPIAADCTDGTQCASGLCVNGKCEAPASTSLPAACGSDAECRAGQRCLNGRCENIGCLNNADCLSGICLNNQCVACASHADCRAGQQCVGGRCIVAPSGAGQNSQTGPEVVAIIAAGAAAGFAWMRRRRLAP